MPETALGLFPDVGASYFLSRLPGFFGNGSYILDLYSNSLDTKSFLKKG
jgi:enoyl-CoA hydratase/carnithine racemase